MEEAMIEEVRTAMDGAVQHLKEEFRGIRAGRASSSLVEGLLVEAYSMQMKLKELATITLPEPRQLLITPFDVNNASAIVRAIEKANLGIRAVLEGKLVRVFFPELDQNRRKELVAQIHKMKENAKVSIRNMRRDANDRVKELKSEGVPEDNVKRLEKHIQDETDRACSMIDEAATAKEKEVMTV